MKWPVGAERCCAFRGVGEMLLGGGLLWWARRYDFHCFWLEHTTKLLAAYLLGFDGMFVFFCGTLRTLGYGVYDFSRNPILAVTPADFWRRYNREAGRFLYEDAFKPLGGVRSPVRVTLLVFLLNGVLHEYLALAITGTLKGYQAGFFALQGIAVAITWRMARRGWGSALGIGLTIAWMVLTTVLFFATVDQFMSWYSHRVR